MEMQMLWACSHCPLHHPLPRHKRREMVIVEHVNSTPLQVKQIRHWTCQDQILTRVHQCFMQGLCDDPDKQPYMRRQDELSVEEGCIWWGSRVIIQTNKTDNDWGVAWSSPRCLKDEIFGSELRVVAKHGRRFGVCYEKMSQMPVQLSGPSSSAVTSMGVAKPTVDESSCGLLRARNEEVYSGGCGCPF